LERFVRNVPYLTGIVLCGIAIGKYHHYFEFQNPRCPPAIMKKTNIVNIPISCYKTANINVKS